MKRRLLRAMTMLETAVAGTISTVVIVGSATVTVSSAKLNKATLATAESGTMLNSACGVLVQDIQSSQSVLNKVQISGFSKNSSNTVLILRRPAVTMAGALVPNQSQTIVYEIGTGRNGKQSLLRSVITYNGTTVTAQKLNETVAEGVTGLKFAFYGKGTSTSTGPNSASTLSTTVATTTTNVTNLTSADDLQSTVNGTTSTVTANVFDGKVAVDATKVVTNPDVTAVTFVEFAATTQTDRIYTYRSGAQLRAGA